MGHFDKYNNTNCILKLQFESIMVFFFSSLSGFSLRILVAGERFNVMGENFERGSTSEYKIFICYRKLSEELFVVKENSLISDA